MNEAFCCILPNTSNIMDEAGCISYNDAIEELRTKEYPMLQGGCSIIYSRIYAHIRQTQPTLTMQGLRSTPSL